MTSPTGGYGEQPVTPAEQQAALTGVSVRGQRIMNTLGFLALLSATSTVLGVLAMLWGWRALPTLLGQLGAGAGDLPPLDTLFPGWLMPSLAGLSLLGGAIYLWALLRTRQTIGAIRQYALNPGQEAAEGLTRSASAIRPWITLGQYSPLILTLFSLVTLPVMLGVMRQLEPSVGTDLAIGPAEAGFMVVSVAVQNLPTIVLTWLILAAIRRWLDAVAASPRQPGVAVRPAARRVDPWLLFTIIVLALGTVLVLLSGLPLLLLPTLMARDLGQGGDLSGLGLSPAVMGAFGVGLFGLMLLGALLYLLLTVLMAWSRGFAMNVATVLDARNPSPASPATDQWSGPVHLATPRDPR